MLKFLLVSIVDSQTLSWDMNFAFTCSHVRFSRRIGGVFRPETIAVMVEKFCNTRHRCIKRRMGQYRVRSKPSKKSTDVRDIDEMLYNPGTFL